MSGAVQSSARTSPGFVHGMSDCVEHSVLASAMSVGSRTFSGFTPVASEGPAGGVVLGTTGGVVLGMTGGVVLGTTAGVVLTTTLGPADGFGVAFENGKV